MYIKILFVSFLGGYMDSLQLLHGLKARDDEAFRMMVLTYGRPVYERL